MAKPYLSSRFLAGENKFALFLNREREREQEVLLDFRQKSMVEIGRKEERGRGATRRDMRDLRV